jgi:alanine-glyoxylate transaminase/serine-glyoxylate transaminase/serine-pyruvate transaminase
MMPTASCGPPTTTIDHRGPEFAALGLKVLWPMCRKIAKTRQPVIITHHSGMVHGRPLWIHAERGRPRALMCETGRFYRRAVAKLATCDWAWLGHDLHPGPEVWHGVQAS